MDLPKHKQLRFNVTLIWTLFGAKDKPNQTEQLAEV